MSTKENILRISEQELAGINDLAEDLRRAEGQPRSVRAWIAQKLGMSSSTFERKRKAFEKEGTAGLIRKERSDKGKSRVADEKVIARIKTEYLTSHRPPVSQIHRKIAKDYEMSGLVAPSYSFVRHVIQTLPPDLIASFRFGDREFDDKFAYITLRKKPDRPREWVDADHHQWDRPVIFRDGSIGRPWLTALQDLCTNEILGFSANSHQSARTYPNRRTIGLALRHGILKKDNPGWPSFGLFLKLYCDLGKDLLSEYVRSVCADLGIEIVHTRGYHGKSKPIERLFRTMETALKHLPGYIGSDPKTNPERQRIGASRTWEEMRGELMTIDELEAALTDWVVKEFHHAESRSLKGLSPIAALQAHVKNGFSPREVRDERALDLLLMSRKQKKVQRFGIEMFGTKGRQRFFCAPELLSLIGQEVEVCWDPARLGEILIYKAGRFLCKATNRELLQFDATEEDLARERALKREQKRSVEERHQQMLMQAQYPNALAQAAAERRYEKVLNEERRKLAVGAEAEGVPALLPKFAQAAKQLKKNPKSEIRNPKLTEAPRSPVVSPPSPEKNPWADDDPLPTAEELFKKVKNPWVEEE